MSRFLALVLVLAVLVGGGAWLASQPAGQLQPIQPSSAAVITAEAKIFTAFAAAGASAVATRHPVQATVSLSDLELTSLVATRLAQEPSSTLSNVVLQGGSDGVLKSTADVAWNGWTFHVYATGTVSFGGDNSLQLDVHDAEVGRLPLPSSVVDAIVAQNTAATSINVPPGISGLALQAVNGGATLTGTVSPDVSRLVP